jgi:hypothetical protein
MMKTILALVFVLLGAACSRNAEPLDRVRTERNGLADSGEGRLYITALAEAIQKSDRIVVTEHSNVDDVLDELTQPQRPKAYHPIVFATHELDPRERVKFLAAVRNMPVKTQDAEPACIFEPHHTITFFREKRQTSVLRVCFQCGQVEWDGSTKMPPWSLVPTLRTLITGLGMKEERDWRALAKTPARVHAPQFAPPR